MSKKKGRTGPKGSQKHNHPPTPKVRERVLRRPWPSKPGVPKSVTGYMARAGLVAQVPADLSDVDLIARFGDAAERYLRGCHIDQHDNVETHALMSANLDMALAIRSQIWCGRYEAFLSWFTTANLPPAGRILDIGCDIGIQTCFFAMQFPDAQITGIDQCVKSIQCARRLAERLGLKNVHFLQATLPTLPEGLADQKFDMVVSSCVAGHFYDEPTTPVRSIEEAQAQPLSPAQLEYARILAGFLADEHSLLVAFDRFLFPTMLARWIWALRAAGIYVRGDRIELLKCMDENDESISIPVLVGIRRATGLATPDEIRQLWVKDHHRRDDAAYRRAMAEWLFVSENPKELIRGVRCTSPEVPSYCRELWQSGSDVLFYLYSDGGLLIDAAPIEDLPEMLEHFQRAARDVRDGEAMEEYGPEAGSRLPAGASDGTAADGPVGVRPDQT